MNLSRRRLLAGTGIGVAAGAGIYELVDQLAGGSPARSADLADGRGVEQHLLAGVREIVDDGVEVLVPPLHHEVVTATVQAGSLATARRELEAALAQLEARYPGTPAGLGITLAWGVPYFRRYVPRQAARLMPIDQRASQVTGRTVSALTDAVRFTSDPEETILEQNDVAILLRSDALAHIADAHRVLFAELGVFAKTSVRRGFAGGGFDGGIGLPKQMAVAAGVKGADLIPDGSELFLGFTSTQKAGLGPARIANFESLGLVTSPDGYFEGGTHMHLSHITEDVEAWYLNFAFRERAETAFRPGIDLKAGARTVPQGPDEISNAADVKETFARTGSIGHSAALQTASRLAVELIGDDGTVYPKGTAIPQRADFNTLDNPFAWSARPGVDGMAKEPAAGVHFVVFNPSSDDFARTRRAMDGELPDGTKLAITPRSRMQGFNAILRTTHRQNFLVPPRRARAFPLSELKR